jgi:tRNA C32,U32 (ribose-2'-O)-methylase TrmJ
MADYDSQFPAAVSQRSAQEVRSEAVVAAQHAADVDAKSKVAPRVKSALTREEVRQAAASANRAGTLPHGELSF